MEVYNKYLLIMIILNSFCTFTICRTDFKSRKIGNTLILFVFSISSLSSFHFEFINHSLLAMLVGGIVGGYLWKSSLLGGGDVKLIIAYIIGIKPIIIPHFLLLTGVIGGVVCYLFLLNARLKKNSTKEVTIPYGIPISISGFVFSTLSMN
ncbi:prepilin peptidase [Vibrio lentus]|nr:prepilin peptidase [Vibrio lentus]